MTKTSFTHAYALITGASHGIGRAMAHECAARGFNLLLVALPDGLLAEVATKIEEKYGVAVKSYAIDLTDEGAVEQVFAWYQSLHVPLHFLINNAGFGTSGWLEDKPWSQYQRMIRLNNEALVGMTYHFLPQLKQQAQSWLLNVGSMESFLPLPYKVVYTGTKQFIYGFSLALREEVRQFGVSVSVLCPGPVVTHEEGIKRLQSQGAKGKLIVTMPEVVARVGIRQALAGRAVIIPGKTNTMIKKLGHYWPRASKMRILERLFRVYVKKGV